MHLNNSGATLPLELKNRSLVDSFSTTGRRAAASACTCLGSSGTMAGSGSSANPRAATEVSSEGLSLKVKSAPSRAPAASMSAASMSCALSENSRSAVSSGPRSESTSTVRNSRRKLSFCTAKRQAARNQSNSRVPRGENREASGCWLVWCDDAGGWQLRPGGRLEVPPQVAKLVHGQQAAGRSGRRNLVMFQDPGLPVRHEHRVQPRSQRRVNVRFRAVADHPRRVRRQFVFGSNRAVDGFVFLRNDLNCVEVAFQP